MSEKIVAQRNGVKSKCFIYGCENGFRWLEKSEMKWKS